jgi:hypothetical protein
MNIGELAKFRGGVSADTISEMTSDSGVTIDALLLKDGNMLPAATKGVDFSANAGTAAAGAATTSESLTWYEEGTWTPSLVFAGAGTGVTYSAQVGHFTRVGRLVQFSVYIVLTSNGSSTGSAAISGLPFTAATQANGGYSACSIHGNKVSATNGSLAATVSENSTSILLYKNPTNADATASTRLSEANIADDASLIITGTYIV